MGSRHKRWPRASTVSIAVCALLLFGGGLLWLLVAGLLYDENDVVYLEERVRHQWWMAQAGCVLTGTALAFAFARRWRWWLAFELAALALALYWLAYAGDLAI